MSDHETTVERESPALQPGSSPAGAMSAAKQALLLRMLRERAERSEPGMGPRPAGAVVPATPAQHMLWLKEQMEPGDAAYNVPVLRRLRGPLDASALERALQSLVARHEALRTTFVEDAGALRQEIAPSARAEVVVLDAPSGATGADESVVAMLAERAAAPFDLVHGPLFRAALMRVAADDHFLLLVGHHIVLDGASIGILLRDLSALYDECVTNAAPAARARAPLQFGDVAVWKAARASQDGATDDLAYWRDQLRGATPVVTLPVDGASINVADSPRAGREVVTLPPALGGALRALAQRSGATTFMGLLTAVYALWRRYGGQDDIVIGSPVAGRDRPELREVVGFLANTIALRVRVSPDETFESLLGEVRRVAVDGFAHADVPFEVVAGALRSEQPPTDVLFNTMVVMQEPAGAPLRFGAAVATPVALTASAPKFDLTLSATETPDGIRVAAEYRTDRLSAGAVTRLLAHLETLLAAAIAAPATPIGALPILAAAERAQVVDVWNATAVEYPADATLVSLIEPQVARTPDAVAVESGGRTLTYGELEARASAFAARLRASGVGRNALVGVCVERSLELMVALLGVLRAGGAYVPLDAEYPVDRLAFMVEDAGLAVVVTQRHLADRLPQHEGTRHVFIDESTPEADSAPVPPGGPAPDDLAYMIYTSGSTGRPKGALNRHRGIVNRLLWMQQTYRLTPSDVVLQKTPISFDVSVWELFWPLIAGARLVMAEPGGHRDADYLVRTIVASRVSVLHFVPSMLQTFLQHPDARSCSGLRDVMCSGEALPFDLQERFFTVLPATRLHNLYGPTEAAVDVSFWACVPHDPRGSVPIGRPVANTQLYVLDGRMQPVPIGVEGELFIGGVQVGAGYHHRPELTDERFLPDPFRATGAGARLYRTGDRARWRSDGAIEYLGRRDHQVKLRGFRIELGEIEAVIAAVPGVEHVTVLVRELAAGDPRLLCYYLVDSRAAASPDASILRDAVARVLPAYMVPSAFIRLQSLPVTSNGKLDRAALPLPTESDAAVSGGAEPAAPRTATETIIASIWSEVLRRPVADVNADFFAAGGHSLLATQIVARISTLFRTRMGLRTFFSNPTIAALAAALVAVEGRAGQTEAMARALVKLAAMSAEERAQRAAPTNSSHD